MPSLVERWARGQAVLLVPSSATEARAASMLAAAGIDAAEVGDCDGAAGAPHGPRGLRAGSLPPEAGVLIATSGTTGTPRLVELGVDALVAGATLGAAAVPFGPGDTWHASLAPHHVGGLMLHVRAAVLGGAVRHAELPRTWADLDGCSHASLVAAQLARLLDGPGTPPATLSAVMLGGGPIPAALRSRAIAAGVPLFTSYGMTETASQAATGRAAADDPATRAGPAIAGVRIAVADAGADGTGELTVDGPTLARAVLVDGARVPLARPHRTRDRGFVDPRGDVHVIGRLDAMIISGGRKIQPEAVERALGEVAGVRTACVVAVPDARWGQRPVAFVDRDTAHAGSMRGALGRALEPHEVPDAFLRMPDDEAALPKPSRARLAARLAAGERFEELS
jgi:O-succinylbenzoic acid--CoA ligase